VAAPAYAAGVDHQEASIGHAGTGPERGPASQLRVYLTGRVSVENGAVVRDEPSLPGRQGRLLFCFLVLNHGRPLARQELVNAVWGDDVPDAVDSSLNALVSKLRRFFDEVGVDGAAALEGSHGAYLLRFPADSWIDIEHAELKFHEAEVAARTGAMPALYLAALVAGAVAGRPFIPGESLPWVVAQRERLQILLVRTLDFRSDYYQWHSEPDLALKLAQEAVSAQPFREQGHLRLMQLLRVQGHRVEALRAYERYRRLLREELGVSPSPQTEALYLSLLKS
jgi:DNA-binding SARP family transcriptional activator